MFVVCRLPGRGTDLSVSIQRIILALAEAWADEIARRPVTPLYKSSVQFKPEPKENLAEEFVDPYTLRERGYGDCDDLVISRLAEIYAQTGWRSITSPNEKMPAWPAVARKLGTLDYHVMIRHADGREEDPSIIILERNKQ